MRRTAFGLAFGAATALVACGLSVTGNGADFVADGGTASVDGNTAETSPADGAGDATSSPNDGSGGPGADAAADVEAGPPPCSCPITAPAGFDLVAYRADQSATCVGDLTKNDRLIAPSASATACSCGTCSVTTMPDCNTGDFGSLSDTNGTAKCDQQGATHPANGGQCTADSNALANHRRAVAPSPSGQAACTSPLTVDQTAVQSTPVRVCAPVANGVSCACDPSLAAGFKTCFRKTGDVDCPSGTKTLVGTGTNITCGSGTCDCSITSQSCDGTIAYYSDSSCKTLIETIDDKSCQSESGNSFNSYKWTGTPNVVCQTGAAPAGTATLTGVETICCP